MTPVEFYFDFASPYGFLAAMQVDGEPFWGSDRIDIIAAFQP